MPLLSVSATRVTTPRTMTLGAIASRAATISASHGYTLRTMTRRVQAQQSRDEEHLADPRPAFLGKRGAIARPCQNRPQMGRLAEPSALQVATITKKDATTGCKMEPEAHRAGETMGKVFQDMGQHRRWSPIHPRMLMAREAAMASVASEMQLSSITSSFARAVSGAASVALNAVAVEKARNR